MQPASRIEVRAAFRASIRATQVFVGCKFGFANAAKHGRFVEPRLWPSDRRVVRDLGVARVAWIIGIAACKFQGDDVDGRVPMRASRLLVDIDTQHGRGARALLSGFGGRAQIHRGEMKSLIQRTVASSIAQSWVGVLKGRRGTKKSSSSRLKESSKTKNCFFSFANATP